MSASLAPVNAIDVRSLRKSYVEGVQVLDGVDLSVPRGRITALVGANGSGKSTLVRVLSGYQPADAGSSIIVDGVDLGAAVTAETIRTAGIRFVHQDSGLVAGLSVLDNMLVGRYRGSAARRIRWREERASVRSLLDAWSVDADLDADVGSLALATVSKLAILRALRPDDGEPLTAVILDEPTAALGRDDARELLTWMRRLAVDQGVGVLFITHRLEEIFAVADRIAVLRAGRIVTEGQTADFSHDALVEQIIGAKVDRFYPEREGAAHREALLDVGDLNGGDVRGVSFVLHAGEVLGVTGLPESGFDDLPYLLADSQRGAVGHLRLSGSEIPMRSGVGYRIQRGLALVPGDRKRKALAVELTIRENLTLPRVATYIRSGFMQRHRERRESDRLIRRFGVKTPSGDVAASQLSGGNQQKVVLAKWLSTSPRVLLVHEPTHGVDVGAKAEIFDLVAAAAAEGKGILIASVEYEDLAHLCDRVLVFSGGRVCAELAGPGLTTETLTAAVFRGATAPNAA